VLDTGARQQTKKNSDVALPLQGKSGGPWDGGNEAMEGRWRKSEEQNKTRRTRYEKGVLCT